MLTVGLSGLSLFLTYPLSITAAYLYAFCFIFVTFVAPGMLVWAQRYKKCVMCTFRDEQCPRRLTYLTARSEAPGTPQCLKSIGVYLCPAELATAVDRPIAAVTAMSPDAAVVAEWWYDASCHGFRLNGRRQTILGWPRWRPRDAPRRRIVIPPESGEARTQTVG